MLIERRGVVAFLFFVNFGCIISQIIVFEIELKIIMLLLAT